MVVLGGGCFLCPALTRERELVSGDVTMSNACFAGGAGGWGPPRTSRCRGGPRTALQSSSMRAAQSDTKSTRADAHFKFRHVHSHAPTTRLNWVPRKIVKMSNACFAGDVGGWGPPQISRCRGGPRTTLQGLSMRAAQSHTKRSRSGAHFKFRHVRAHDPTEMCTTQNC